MADRLTQSLKRLCRQVKFVRHVTSRGEIWVVEYWCSDRKAWIPILLDDSVRFVSEYAEEDIQKALDNYRENYGMPSTMKYRARKWVRA